MTSGAVVVGSPGRNGVATTVAVFVTSPDSSPVTGGLLACSRPSAVEHVYNHTSSMSSTPSPLMSPMLGVPVGTIAVHNGSVRITSSSGVVPVLATS